MSKQEVNIDELSVSLLSEKDARNTVKLLKVLAEIADVPLDGMLDPIQEKLDRLSANMALIRRVIKENDNWRGQTRSQG